MILVMAYSLFCTKELPKPIMTYFKFGSQEQRLVKFESK